MKHRLGFFAKLAFVAILFFLLVSIVDKNIEINALKKEEAMLRAQAQEYTTQVEKLNARLNEEISEESIKRIAKEKLNLREPGSIIYASDLPN